MKKILLICLAYLPFVLHAQNDQKEINDQVWKPFTKAIMEQDVAAFVTLHSNDMIRVDRNSKRVMDLSEYHKNMENGWPAWKESLATNNVKYSFELRFTERISNNGLAYEVGYFKNESLYPSGEKQVGYGAFHVTLRKEEGTWKILVDSDSNEGGAITEELFLNAKALE